MDIPHKQNSTRENYKRLFDFMKSKGLFEKFGTYEAYEKAEIQELEGKSFFKATEQISEKPEKEQGSFGDWKKALTEEDKKRFDYVF